MAKEGLGEMAGEVGVGTIESGAGARYKYTNS